MPARLQLRLSHKIISIAILSLVGLLAFGAIYLFSSSAEDAAGQVADNARSTNDLTERLFVAMLEARRAEKDFRLSHDEAQAKRHAELSTAIGADFEQLKAMIREGGNRPLLEKVDAAQAGYTSYDRDFAGLVAAEKTLGLTESEGLSGALRTAVHAIEDMLKDIDDPSLTSGMLLMRRHEKDFMLRRDAKYVAELKTSVDDFAKALAKAEMPAATKAKISRQLDIYQKEFLAWADGAMEIAKRAGAMSQTFHAIEPTIDEMQQSVERMRRDAVAAEAKLRASARAWLMIAFWVTAGVVGAVSTLIGLSVSRALSGMVKAMLSLSEGDFDVVLPGLGRKDEIGDMAGAVEKFKLKAQEKARLESEAQRERERVAAEQRKRDMYKLADDFESAVGEIIEIVSSASTELEASACSLTGTAERSQTLAKVVASAAEEASTNVQTVAAATEELSSSVNEISRQVQGSARMAGEAVQQARKTNDSVGELSKVASRIGDVVELINTIAGQTNLLALNATIEAARAGEAGRGFAVVAAEVKALAEQTAKATGEISRQVGGIQAATATSVEAIREIGGTIGSMSEIASTIAAAVEEQGAATEEIARNVQEAAQNTMQVSSNIADVERGSSATGTASSQVLSAAQALASESNRLKLEVGRFLGSVRAA